MYYLINANKDASIYSLQPNQNTGLDEVLEVSKTYILGQKSIARSLIQFDLDSATHVPFSSMSISELILKECEASEIPIDYNLYVYPISSSWDMGIGTKFDEISSAGVTWRNASTETVWLVSGSDYITGSVSSSQEFSYQSSDVAMDVTDIVNEWNSGSLTNYGVLLKLSNANEINTSDYGTLNFFGKETNTVYQPKLRVGVYDTTFVTGSLPELDDGVITDIHVALRRLKSTYKQTSVPRIEVVGRELYPLRDYNNEYGYTDEYYLPETTYYQIKDVITDEIILPFSDYTKVSCDERGNYFKLNLVNWELNREYYVEIKVERMDGSIEYFSDNDQSFVVEE